MPFTGSSFQILHIVSYKFLFSLVTLFLLRLLAFNVNFFFLSLTPTSFFLLYYFPKKRWDNRHYVCCFFGKSKVYRILRFSGEWLEFIRSSFESMKKYYYRHCVFWECELNLSGLLKCLVVLAHNEDLPVSGRSSYCDFPHQNVNPNEWSLDSLLGLTYQSTISLAIYVSESEISITRNANINRTYL